MMSKWLQQYVDGLSGPLKEKFCNTFDIVDAALGAGSASGYWDGHPGYRTQFNNVALTAAATFVGCTSAFSTGFLVRNVRAYIWMKNYLRGVATLGYNSVHEGMLFHLEVATGTGAFTTLYAGTGTPVIDMRYAARATSALLLNGVVPDNQNIAAARIAVYPTVNQLTDTASFDC